MAEAYGNAAGPGMNMGAVNQELADARYGNTMTGATDRGLERAGAGISGAGNSIEEWLRNLMQNNQQG